MIGKDEQEEVTFKVADRRKFNADGSLKEGVTIEPAPPPAAEQAVVADTDRTLDQDVEAETDEPAAAQPDGEVPGLDDPASFINFLSTLATNAAAALGAVPHPATGQRMLDLDTGKYWLDILAMLKEKTAGNLHPEETRMLDNFLAEMRLHYVQMMKAAEEKLKAQAAKKFSADEILGKK
ncbi:MAG: DUF1844 domain-containing protein [Acidobacteria bacterium]|nr:DUF1844 domain-containing protein [Acidobacteriota bacterium]MCW5950248.1 DUF1844 domain-containing protein [Pyrinomonadaceae bacterium]